jgi:hypothetical protein
MTTETQNILDQLAEAINSARSTGKIMYVFRDDDRWWYCGRLPYNAVDYYIAYPTGHSDRSTIAPDIAAEDWDAYWQAHGGKPAFTCPKTRSRKKKNSPQTKPGRFKFIMNFAQMKRFFITYCAFAPHVALSLCFAACCIMGMTTAAMWNMALPVCLVCVPLTLLWVLSALHHPKSEKLGLIGATLATEAHFAFYVHLALIGTNGTADNTLFLFTFMGSLAFSGVALLLLWDNDKPAPMLSPAKG